LCLCLLYFFFVFCGEFLNDETFVLGFVFFFFFVGGGGGGGWMCSGKCKPIGQFSSLLIQQNGCGLGYKLQFLTGLLNFLSIASSKLPLRSSKPIITEALQPVMQQLEPTTDWLSSRSI